MLKTLASFFNHKQWKAFNRRINKAYNMQVEEHNTPNAPDSTPAIKAVESYAKMVGLKTIWPGLYPVFEDNDKRQYHLS
jgi:hypothetical protein